MTNDEAILKDFVFWGRLSRVANATMMASGDKALRRQWIDDFLPESAKASNDGLRVEGAAHLMGHKNGHFGTYHFVALLAWKVVRHAEQEPAIERIELDHHREEISLVVSPSR